MNLGLILIITQLKKNFPDAIVGLSDHTISNFTSYGAIALGAKIIERHFVDSDKRKGPDIPCSMTPTELKQLIVGSKIIFKSIRLKKKVALKKEKKTMNFAL